MQAIVPKEVKKLIAHSDGYQLTEGVERKLIDTLQVVYGAEKEGVKSPFFNVVGVVIVDYPAGKDVFATSEEYRTPYPI